MKKLLSIALTLALALTLFVGCQSSSPAEGQNPSHTPPANGNTVQNEAPVPQETTVPTEPVPTEPLSTEPVPETKLTREEALEIALKDAGLTKDQIRDLDIELDRDGGALHYDVDFEKDDKDYDYEIDAETGKILRKEVPKIPSTSSSSSSSKQLSRTEARDIALKHAGLTVSQVRDLEVELDRDGEKLHYDVDFEADGYDYDYEIDAQSGKILKSRKERD